MSPYSHIVTASLRHFTVLGLACALPLSISYAATFNWDGGGTNNLFSNEENWDLDDGVPSTDDTAEFNVSGDTVVEFDSSATIANFIYRGSDSGPVRSLRLNLNGHTLATTEITYPSSDPRDLVIDGGSFNITPSNAWRPDLDANTTSLLRLQNAATMHIDHSNISWIPDTGRLDLEIVEGSTFAMGGGSRWQMRGNSTGLVSGIGSSITSDSSGNSAVFGIGVGSGNADLEVESGAMIDFGRHIRVGWAGGTGKITVTGSDVHLVEGDPTTVYSTVATLDNTGFLSVGGDNSGGSGVGTVVLENGGRSTVHNVDIWDNSTLEINSGFMQANGRLQLAEEATFIVWLHDVSQSAIADVGNLQINGALLELELGVGFSADLGDTFILVEYSNLTGAFSDDIIDVGGYLFEVDYNFDNNNQLAVTVIPEPTAALTFGVLVGLLAFIRLRRRI